MHQKAFQQVKSFNEISNSLPLFDLFNQKRLIREAKTAFSNSNQYLAIYQINYSCNDFIVTQLVIWGQFQLWQVDPYDSGQGISYKVSKVVLNLRKQQPLKFRISRGLANFSQLNYDDLIRDYYYMALQIDQKSYFQWKSYLRKICIHLLIKFNSLIQLKNLQDKDHYLF
ncbi:unnamed protein product [Paramecium sonneborni]|uniref:Uncharacterized protein n=1 Tax=Paramecium sonneborni TaxID=65129 RepID=A0A8S1N9J6_9CILI|nr:unnamed protein product [Paramecium sonneborni]